MKIYIHNLNIPNLSHLKKNEKKNTWFLSYFGKYKISQNKIILYKLKNTKNKNIVFHNYKCSVNNELWEKSKEIHYLPKDCVPITIHSEIYNIDSKLSFIIEKVNNTINDYYFETCYDLDDFCLKNELISFLQT